MSQSPPDDTPHSGRHPTLDRLNVLVGEWEFDASVGGQQLAVARTTFAWLEGGSFLVQRAHATGTASAEWQAHSPLPTVTIIGLDDSAERFSALYADARDVFRVYQMTLNDGVWTQWRDAPGFRQRLTARIDADGQTITGAWEMSRDETTWTHDFDVTLTRITP